MDLKGQIIILDEAHNIEDICRDVASKTIREDHIDEVMKECESLAEIDFDVTLKITYRTILNYCKLLSIFIKDQLVYPIVSNF